MSSNIESAITYIRDHIILYEDSDDDVISKEVFLMILNEIDKMLTKELNSYKSIDYYLELLEAQDLELYGNIEAPQENKMYIREDGFYIYKDGIFEQYLSLEDLKTYE